MLQSLSSTAVVIDALRVNSLYTNRFILLFDAINLGWNIVNIEGSQVIISKQKLYFSENCFCFSE